VKIIKNYTVSIIFVSVARKYSVGIIGCGWSGERHARAYLKLNNVRIKSVADID
jgi:hypothetical protein